MSEKEAPLIYAKISDAVADVKAIAKTGKGSYRAQTIDSICNGLHEILKTHRIFPVPRCLTHTVEQVVAGDKKPFHAVVTMQYTFYADDGSSVELVTVGEGLDYSDKACGKAMTCAMKYAFRQLFSLPTADDSDNAPNGDGQSPADRANEFLTEKGNQPPQPQAPVPVAIAFFHSQATQLSERDLNGWPLADADYRQIVEGVMAIDPTVTDYNAGGVWLRDHGALEHNTDGDDNITGITVKRREPIPQEGAANGKV